MEKIRLCESEDEIASTFAVMNQLRPEVEEGSYVGLIKKMIADYGYSLYGYFEKNKCLGAVGCTIDERLWLGKTLYVADLIVDAENRATSIGSKLIEKMKRVADDEGCKAISLDSGVHRPQAHKFYFREGFEIAGFNFKLSNSEGE